VALLIPADAEPPSPRADDVWARLERLGKEVAERWASDKSAVEVLSEMRR
jgi:hypothetical protein